MKFVNPIRAAQRFIKAPHPIASRAPGAKIKGPTSGGGPENPAPAEVTAPPPPEPPVAAGPSPEQSYVSGDLLDQIQGGAAPEGVLGNLASGVTIVGDNAQQLSGGQLIEGINDPLAAAKLVGSELGKGNINVIDDLNAIATTGVAGDEDSIKAWQDRRAQAMVNLGLTDKKDDNSGAKSDEKSPSENVQEVGGIKNKDAVPPGGARPVASAAEASAAIDRFGLNGLRDTAPGDSIKTTARPDEASSSESAPPIHSALTSEQQVQRQQLEQLGIPADLAGNAEYQELFNSQLQTAVKNATRTESKIDLKRIADDAQKIKEFNDADKSKTAELAEKLKGYGAPEDIAGEKGFQDEYHRLQMDPATRTQPEQRIGTASFKPEDLVRQAEASFRAKVAAENANKLSPEQQQEAEQRAFVRQLEGFGVQAEWASDPKFQEIVKQTLQRSENNVTKGNTVIDLNGVISGYAGAVDQYKRGIADGSIQQPMRTSSAEAPAPAIVEEGGEEGSQDTTSNAAGAEKTVEAQGEEDKKESEKVGAQAEEQPRVVSEPPGERTDTVTGVPGQGSETSVQAVIQPEKQVRPPTKGERALKEITEKLGLKVTKDTQIGDLLQELKEKGWNIDDTVTQNYAGEAIFQARLQQQLASGSPRGEAAVGPDQVQPANGPVATNVGEANPAASENQAVQAEAAGATTPTPENEQLTPEQQRIQDLENQNNELQQRVTELTQEVKKLGEAVAHFKEWMETQDPNKKKEIVKFLAALIALMGWGVIQRASGELSQQPQ